MSQQQDVARAILESPTEWTATAEIAATLGFSRPHCASYVSELRALKHIESRKRGIYHEHRALPSLELYVHNAPRDFQRKGDRYRKGKPSDVPMMLSLAAALMR